MTTGFVERMGSQLVLDGSPFRSAGANNYYFAFREGDEQTRLLDLAESLSLNVLRIWAFNDFKPAAGGALPGESDVCFQFMRPGGRWPELREGARGSGAAGPGGEAGRRARNPTDSDVDELLARLRRDASVSTVDEPADPTTFTATGARSPPFRVGSML